MTQRRFTEEQDAKIASLYMDGLSSIEIAKTYGVHKSTILESLNRSGIERRNSTKNNSRPLTPEEKTELAKIYIVGKVTATRIAKAYHRCVTQTCAYLNQLNVENRGSRNFTDEEEDEIVKIYQAGYGIKRIARAYHFSHHISISSALERNGINVRPNSIANRLYEINPFVFDEMTPEAAYWWGFLYADGSVNKRSLSVGLQGSDKSHLEKLARFLGSTSPITDRVDHTRKYKVCGLFVTHSHLANRLVELGIVCKRTKPEAVKEHLPPHLYSHWIRGLFDGDGSATVRNNALGISLCGSKELMYWLQEILHQVTGSKANPHKHSISSIYYIIINGNRVAHALSDYMYRDATVWMERKRNKIESATHHE